ncbi:uncharacterized protein N7496_001302 [Penicillium cataractarum]|uniref:Uncharacterized protein n=1 Tax=Penicillium cataractarum TaxID=2100454 RepID=A0A9W9VW33_9EURO|nr:uncharacterized protein N7496_001302 [Penicillium cataractarum]KAJ5390234.1 hypothetical protein N7496_001302 [Penicillium cataractarum]
MSESQKSPPHWIDHERTSISSGAAGAQSFHLEQRQPALRVLVSQQPATVAPFVSVVGLLKLVNFRVATDVVPRFHPIRRPGCIGCTQPQTLVPYDSSTPQQQFNHLNPSQALDLVKLPPIPNRDTIGTIAEPRSPLKHPDRRHGEVDPSACAESGTRPLPQHCWASRLVLGLTKCP